MRTRREFLGVAAAGLAPSQRFAKAQTAAQPGLDFPLEDYHVHLNSMTLEQVIARSRETGVKYGLLKHLGTKENEYPIMLSIDKELLEWIAKLQDQGVYIGAQAEWIDWVPCFSREVL